jgi:predicted proteasome-type protease
MRRTRGRRLENLKQSCAGFDIEVTLDITYFHRPRRRWKDSVKMGLKEIEDMDWIALTQDRDRWRALVNVVVNLRVP